MKQIILFQNKHQIDYQTNLVHKLAKPLTEKVIEISDMIGEIPSLDDLQNFFDGGSILHQKLENQTLNDAKSFRSSSAKRAFEQALNEEKTRLSGIKASFHRTLADHFLSFGIFDMDGNGRLSVKESHLQEIIEVNTIRATPGSPRYKIFQMAQTASEAIDELRKALLENGVNSLIPVTIPIDAGREGVIYSNEHNGTSIQHSYFGVIPDEVPVTEKAV